MPDTFQSHSVQPEPRRAEPTLRRVWNAKHKAAAPACYRSGGATTVPSEQGPYDSSGPYVAFRRRVKGGHDFLTHDPI